MTTTVNTNAATTAANEGAFNALSIEQLLEEINYVDEALESLSLERELVGNCEEISELESRYYNCRRKLVRLLGFES